MLEIIIEIKEKDNSIFHMPMLLFFLWLAVNNTIRIFSMLTINKYMDCPCAHERR